MLSNFDIFAVSSWTDMHLPLVGCLLLHCKMPANLVLTLQVICISASWSGASLPSLQFSPCLYNKTHNKVLQTTFYCQWHLHFLRLTDSDTSAYAKSPNCAWSSRCGMPPLPLELVKNAVWCWSMESWSLRSPFQACVGAVRDITLKKMKM